MDNNYVFEKLMYIEQRAARSWNSLAAEKIAFAARGREEIIRRTEIIEQETDSTIQTISQSLHQQAEANVNRIYSDHQCAIKRVEDMFAKHQHTWRERLVQCILEV
jgi:flagellar motor switch protein FliG